MNKYGTQRCTVNDTYPQRFLKICRTETLFSMSFVQHFLRRNCILKNWISYGVFCILNNNTYLDYSSDFFIFFVSFLGSPPEAGEIF